VSEVRSPLVKFTSRFISSQPLTAPTLPLSPRSPRSAPVPPAPRSSPAPTLRTRQDLDVVVSELDARSYELSHKEDLLAQVSVDLADRQKRAVALVVDVSEAQVGGGSV
jgi:hypothetical protein